MSIDDEKVPVAIGAEHPALMSQCRSPHKVRAKFNAEACTE
jgi:hypothetical protein